MSQRYKLILLIILISFSVRGQSILNAALTELANDPSLKFGSLGISVIDIRSGRQLASYNPNQSMIPASSLKVVTTATALKVLGSDFQFKTQLQYSGSIDSSGTLKGNIYIKGYGDPTLGSDHYDAADNLNQLMRTFVEQIQQLGIKKIEGLIVGDGSFFETAVNARTWLWEDLGNYYASGAWGLNIHENRYFLSFQQTSRLGAVPKIVRIHPEIPNLIVLNEVKAAPAGTGDNAFIFGAPFSSTRFVRGTIPVGSQLFTIKGAIPDPPFFAAHSLMVALNKGEIVTEGHPISQFELERAGADAPPRQVIYTHYSPPLRAIVEEANQKSNNLYCESMLKWIGYHQLGEASTDAGVRAIRSFWYRSGLNMEGAFLEDGSGLSPRNAIPAFHLANIMRKIYLDEELFRDFRPSLPSRSWSGSPNVKVQAKSGSMARVRSFTGFAENQSGQPIAFCIIANNFTGDSSIMRQKLLKFMEVISLTR